MIKRFKLISTTDSLVLKYSIPYGLLRKLYFFIVFVIFIIINIYLINKLYKGNFSWQQINDILMILLAILFLFLIYISFQNIFLEKKTIFNIGCKVVIFKNQNIRKFKKDILLFKDISNIGIVYVHKFTPHIGETYNYYLIIIDKNRFCYICAVSRSYEEIFDIAAKLSEKLGKSIVDSTANLYTEIPYAVKIDQVLE